MTIEAVVFDFGGVFTASPFTGIHAWHEEKGLDPAIADQIWEYVQLKGGREIVTLLQEKPEVIANESAKAGLEDMALLCTYLDTFDVLPSLSIDMSLAKPGHIGEAISGDGPNPNGLLQEGQRLAIPPAVPMPQGLSPLGQKVFRAYQRYGAFVIDVAGGVTNLRAQANAYDRATIAALRRDVARITRLLERVEFVE